jgi:2-methylcitrate dehydratase PrpD
VRDPKIVDIIKKINVSVDPALDHRGETALEMEVLTKSGASYHQSIDFPTGFPENPLTKEENMERFRNCVSYAKKPLHEENIEKLVSSVGRLEEVEDVRSLIPLLLYPDS